MPKQSNYSDKEILHVLRDHYNNNKMLKKEDPVFTKIVVKLKHLGYISDAVKCLSHKGEYFTTQYLGFDFPLNETGENILLKNWYQRLQEKTWFVIIRDLFALTGATLSVIALIYTVFFHKLP